ncbi:MAG: TIM barrel protein [Thermomicrobiales bacterium]
MPRFAPNLSMLFTEVPFLDRFALAAQAGFTAVEFQFPYTESPEAIREELDRNHLELVLFNLPGGDHTAGERGLAALPNRREEFGQSVREGIAYARVLNPHLVNCLAGRVSEEDENDGILIANIHFTAEALKAVDVGMVIEALNDRDTPDYALPTSRSVLELMAEVESDNVRLQFDVYHAVRMGEDPFAIIRQFAHAIGHIQIADAPGRHEPGTGAIDFPALFDLIDRSGYDGWVGLEYNPAGNTIDSFGVLRSLGVLNAH